MSESDTCPSCGKPLYDGKYRNFITCYVCKVKFCKSCSKNSFCLEHYNELTDVQKKKIKSNKIFFIVFGFVLPVLLSLMIIPIAILFPNIFIGIPESTIIIYVITFIVLLGVYIISMQFLKDKKVNKILKGFVV